MTHIYRRPGRPTRLRHRMSREPIEGYVWCNKLGEIHVDDLDPYWFGEPKEGEEDARCQPSDHRKIYKRREED